jgi:hypothetical protein
MHRTFVRLDHPGIFECLEQLVIRQDATASAALPTASAHGVKGDVSAAERQVGKQHGATALLFIVARFGAYDK